MDGSVFFGLVHNAVLLSAPAHIYDVMVSRRAFLPERLGIGVLSGSLGIVLMRSPWHCLPGIFPFTFTLVSEAAADESGFLPAVKQKN